MSDILLFLFQEGTSVVTVDDKEYELHHNDTMLIRCGQE